MCSEYDMIDEKASKELKSIISGLRSDFQFYECDFEYEYSPFEEAIKDYCDRYADFYIENHANDVFFDSLTFVIEAIVNCNANCYDEDFFRPIELITYYLGKLVYSSEDYLKEEIREWLIDFCDENDGDFIVEDYFKVFLDGKKIYHADSYYTGYKDFNKMVLVFKKMK